MRTRKLIGTVLLLAFLIAYAALAGAIGAGRISTAHPLVQFTYFVAAGLAWVLPAGLLVRWMQKQDAETPFRRR